MKKINQGETKMNNRFAEHVTSTAFHLSLSKRMIDAMCSLDKNKYMFCSDSTARSLETRGLVVKSPKAYEGNKDALYVSGGYVLSDAGKAVIPLIRMAGLFPAYMDEVWDAPEPMPEIEIRLKPEFTKDV